MPNPRTRHSKSRKRKRRTHYKIVAPNVSNCANCGAPTMMHHVCGECGHYKGKQVVASREERTKA